MAAFSAESCVNANSASKQHPAFYTVFSIAQELCACHVYRQGLELEKQLSIEGKLQSSLKIHT